MVQRERRRRMPAMACLLAPLLFLAADLPAPRGYVCPRAVGPVTVDGRPDEAAWRDVPWTDDFVDIEGDARPRPRFRTRAKMAWDDRYLYVAAELEEPHVWATLTAHDAVIFHDNDFEVFIDPDGDNHEYYEIEINALNAEWDLLLNKPYRDGGPARDGWEVPGLLKAVHVRGTRNDPADRDEDWSVELAIPWAALAEHARRATPPRDGDQWRVNFSRVEWPVVARDGRYEKVPGRREDNWVWSPQGAVDMHRPERWGYVQFSTAPLGKTAYRPDPDAPARDLLMRLYHAQRAYFVANRCYATRLDALKLGDDPRWKSVTLVPTRDGYEATLAGTSRRWRVRQDSRLRPEG
jgi:hypothetical protein